MSHMKILQSGHSITDIAGLGPYVRLGRTAWTPQPIAACLVLPPGLQSMGLMAWPWGINTLATCWTGTLEYADLWWIKAFPNLMQGCEGELKRREKDCRREAKQHRCEEAKERAKEREARENDRYHTAEQRHCKEVEEREAQDCLAEQRQCTKDMLRWNVICEANYQEEKRCIDNLKHAGELMVKKAQDQLHNAVTACKAKLATPPQFIPGRPSVKSSATKSSGSMAKKWKTQDVFVEISKLSPIKSSASSKLKGKLHVDSKAIEKACDKGKGKGKLRPKVLRHMKSLEVEWISPPPDWKPEGIECLPKAGEPSCRSQLATQGCACQACTVWKAACSNLANTGKRAAAAAAASTSLVDWQQLVYVLCIVGNLTANEADLFRLDCAIANASFEIATWESRWSLAQAQREAICNQMSTPGTGPSRPLKHKVDIIEVEDEDEDEEDTSVDGDVNDRSDGEEDTDAQVGGDTD
ncbi:hypothetical protein BC834DRAFT_988596 [Gloeopeniophorella convolvens]|nr:hypothetical protein BC834DRAFT_988596 [Gloeopeniophorella convolvens]